MVDNEPTTPAEPAPSRLDVQAEIGDLRNTPGYMDGSLKMTNPARWQRTHERIAKLTEQTLTPGDRMNPMERAMNEALDGQAAEQSMRVEQAKAVMADLAELGYDRSDVPADITDFEIAGLVGQGLLAKRDYESFAYVAREGIGRLPASARNIAEGLLRKFRAAQGQEKDEIGSRLIFHTVGVLQECANLKRNCKGKAS